MQDLKLVWKQRQIPVVLRRTGPKELLRARLPDQRAMTAHHQWFLDRQWLQNGKRIAPKWSYEKDCWELPKAWFNDFVDRCLDKYGKVYIVQPFRPQEKCAPACMNATGHECQCSCMGQNHGAGNDGSWFEVSETFAFRWKGRELACRLLTAKK